MADNAQKTGKRRTAVPLRGEGTVQANQMVVHGVFSSALRERSKIIMNPEAL
jgi:hypothetical protein